MGIGLSGLCAVHCLLIPVILAALPLWPFAEAVHAWTHPILFVLIVPTVIFAIQKSRNVAGVSIFLYSGLSVIGLAWLLHDLLGSRGEAVVTLAGSVLLVAGHWMNFKHHKFRHKHHETP